jgi:hypothetical protein
VFLSFQEGLGVKARTTPDVSYNAAVNGGVLIFTTFVVGTPVGFSGAKGWDDATG